MSMLDRIKALVFVDETADVRSGALAGTSTRSAAILTLRA